MYTNSIKNILLLISYSVLKNIDFLQKKTEKFIEHSAKNNYENIYKNTKLN